jgi:predicted nucleic acid-binding protein
MNALRFIDTNVLLYSISRDPAEALKRDIRNRGRACAYLAELQGAGDHATSHDQRA